MSINLFRELESLIEDEELKYFSDLLRGLYLDSKSADEIGLTEGFDICSIVNIKEIDVNAPLIKELALQMKLIRPAKGKSESQYFLTLNGFAIGKNDHNREKILKSLVFKFLRAE